MLFASVQDENGEEAVFADSLPSSKKVVRDTFFMYTVLYNQLNVQKNMVL